MYKAAALLLFLASALGVPAALQLRLRAAPPRPAAAVTDPPATPRAALVGDSLAYEAKSYFSFFAATRGYDVETHAFGGTAPCDWAPDIADMAARPEPARPSTVVFEFTGNAFSGCMRPAGAPLPPTRAILWRYQRDVLAEVATLEAAGIHPVLALSPAVGHRSLVPDINDLWRRMAGHDPRIGLLDAGVLLDTPSGGFTRTLPCGAWEGPAQGCDDGVVTVRAADRTHFCPTIEQTVDGVVGICPVPSPGAVRYGMSLAAALAPLPPA